MKFDNNILLEQIILENLFEQTNNNTPTDDLDNKEKDSETLQEPPGLIDKLKAKWKNFRSRDPLIVSWEGDVLNIKASQYANKFNFKEHEPYEVDKYDIQGFTVARFEKSSTREQIKQVKLQLDKDIQNYKLELNLSYTDYIKRGEEKIKYKITNSDRIHKFFVNNPISGGLEDFKQLFKDSGIKIKTDIDVTPEELETIENQIVKAEYDLKTKWFKRIYNNYNKWQSLKLQKRFDKIGTEIEDQIARNPNYGASSEFADGDYVYILFNSILGHDIVILPKDKTFELDIEELQTDSAVNTTGPLVPTDIDLVNGKTITADYIQTAINNSDTRASYMKKFQSYDPDSEERLTLEEFWEAQKGEDIKQFDTLDFVAVGKEPGKIGKSKFMPYEQYKTNRLSTFLKLKTAKKVNELTEKTLKVIFNRIQARKKIIKETTDQTFESELQGYFSKKWNGGSEVYQPIANIQPGKINNLSVTIGNKTPDEVKTKWSGIGTEGSTNTDMLAINSAVINTLSSELQGSLNSFDSLFADAYERYRDNLDDGKTGDEATEPIRMVGHTTLYGTDLQGDTGFPKAVNSSGRANEFEKFTISKVNAYLLEYAWDQISLAYLYGYNDVSVKFPLYYWDGSTLKSATKSLKFKYNFK